MEASRVKLTHLNPEEDPLGDYLRAQVDEDDGEEDDLRDEDVDDIQRRVEVSKVKSCHQMGTPTLRVHSESHLWL